MPGSLGILLAISSARGESQYEVTIIQAPECPPFGSPPTFGLGINNLGHVVGFHWNCALDDEAFVWMPESGLVTLERPPEFSEAEAWDISDSG